MTKAFGVGKPRRLMRSEKGVAATLGRVKAQERVALGDFVHQSGESYAP